MQLAFDPWCGVDPLSDHGNIMYIQDHEQMTGNEQSDYPEGDPAFAGLQWPETTSPTGPQFSRPWNNQVLVPTPPQMPPYGMGSNQMSSQYRISVQQHQRPVAPPVYQTSMPRNAQPVALNAENLYSNICRSHQEGLSAASRARDLKRIRESLEIHEARNRDRPAQKKRRRCKKSPIAPLSLNNPQQQQITFPPQCHSQQWILDPHTKGDTRDQMISNQPITPPTAMIPLSAPVNFDFSQMAKEQWTPSGSINFSDVLNLADIK